MPVLDLTIEQVVQLVKQLPPEGKKAVLDALKEEKTEPEHHWMKFAGKYKDDSQFDEMLTDIETERRELDAKMEEYYRKLDAKEGA